MDPAGFDNRFMEQAYGADLRRPSTAPATLPNAGPHSFSLTQVVFFVGTIILAQVSMLVGIAQALIPAQIIGQSFPDVMPGDLFWYSA